MTTSATGDRSPAVATEEPTTHESVVGSVSVEIDQQMFREAVQSVVGKGIAEGVGSWETQRLVREAVERSVDMTQFPAVIEAALTEQLNAALPSMATEIIADVLPMVQEAFRLAFRNALRSMVYGLALGVPGGGYMSDETKRAWAEAQRVLGENSSESDPS